MGAVVEGREFVLDAVARPVLRASDAADVVVREGAGTDTLAFTARTDLDLSSATYLYELVRTEVTALPR